MKNILEEIAKVLNKDRSQIQLADIQAKIPSLKTTADKYARQAVEAEAAALANKGKAFSPDVSAVDRAKFMRQAMMDANRAKTLSGFAGTFVTQYGNFLALETTMQIANEMKEVGLIESDIKAIDWQNAMDTMQVEIQQMISTTQKLGHVMTGALSIDNSIGSSEEDELENLFKAWESEVDPVKKAEIQKQIESKTKLSLV